MAITLMSEHTSLLPQLVKLARSAALDDVVALGLVIVASAVYLLRGILWDKPDPFHYTWFERPQEKDGEKKNPEKETRNIAQKLEGTGKDIVVFFGSQSGTAEAFAHRLSRELHLRFGAGVLSADLSDYDAESISQIPSSKVVIFILSTFGEGDPSDNTAEFWEWTTKSPSLSLPNLRYAAFGLGNRNYKYYNKVVDVVTNALSMAGATTILPTGHADDSVGATEEDFMEWKESLHETMQRDLGYQQRELSYEPTIAVVEDESLTSIDLYLGEPPGRRHNRKSSSLESQVRALKVTHSKELFTTSQRNCVHIEFDLNAFPDLKYRTGDHLAVWPSNPDVEVSRLLGILALDDRKDIPISVNAIEDSSAVSIPTPTTVHALFRHYLEVCAPVSRDTISSLCQFAPSASAKAFLHALGSNKESYSAHVQRTHITLGRLLEQAAEGDPWFELPLSFIIENLPPLRPRYYSISSSSVVQARQLSITAVVDVKQLHPESPEHILGLTSNYLLALKQALHREGGPQPHPYGLTYFLDGPKDALQGGKVFAQVRKSKFKLPVMASHSIIMVAAGTGIAPFRGFLQERARLKSMCREVGNMILFFGCRRSDEDFLYKEELAEMMETFDGKLQIITAFSREQSKKVYVQDRVAEHTSEITDLLQADASFYICGSASMAREVAGKVGDAMKDLTGWDDVQLKAWSERAKRTNRWQEDVWG